MKKFHDVRPKAEVPKEDHHIKNLNDDGIFDFFWGDQNVSQAIQPKLRSKKLKKPRKLLSQKVVFLSGLAILFLALSTVLVFNAKEKMEISTKNASASLERALELMSQGEMEAATIEAEKAAQEIYQTKLRAQSIGQDFGYLSMISNKSSKIVDTERLLNATNYLLEGVLDIRKQFGGNLKNNVAHAAENNVLSFDINKNAELFRKISDQVKNKINASEDLLLKIDVNNMPDQKANIEKATKVVAGLKTTLNDLDNFLNQDLNWLTGIDGSPKKILLVFQNNAELRGGSGGSFGSFGIMNFNNGKFEKIDFGKNIYKIDQEFKSKTTIEPPAELSDLVLGQWTMKDSGWAVDGNMAMQKMQWFYEKETRDEVQGVMTIDTTAFEKILELIGPISMPEYKKTITAENFRAETEAEVHSEYFTREGNAKENEPKKIIGEMMPIVMEKLFSSFTDEKQAMAFLNTGSNLLKQKHIMLSVDEEKFQDRLNRYNYSGKIYDNNYEYLSINNSNVHGFKSSLSVQSDILLESKISASGKVDNKLIYTRSHNGSDKLPDGVNNNFVRVLLPKNSKLGSLNAVLGGSLTWNGKNYGGDGQGYSSSKEGNRDSVSFWMNTKPKEQSKIELTYSFSTDVLNKNEIVYPILFQKQPGALYDNVTYRLTLPQGFAPIGDIPFDQKTKTVELKMKLESDKLTLLRLKRI